MVNVFNPNSSLIKPWMLSTGDEQHEIEQHVQHERDLEHGPAIDAAHDAADLTNTGAATEDAAAANGFGEYAC
jgi:hypothetical protein